MTAVTRYIDTLQDQGGLRRTDIANLANVSYATVQRWKAGSHLPAPHTQLLLARLDCVIGRLDEFYTPEEIRLWLYAPHPQLDGQRAIDSIVDGRSEAVIAVIDHLDAGSYL